MKNAKILYAVIGVIFVLAIAWRLWPGGTPAPTVPKVPYISELQFGTYSTSTKSIVTEKNTFSQTEEIGVRGLVNDLPAGSLMLIIMSKDNQNYYANQLPNKTAIDQEPFHFTYGQKRPAGTYTVMLELFGPNNQQIGEKIEKQFTVK